MTTTASVSALLPWHDPVDVSYRPIEQVLREYGQEGWELYGVVRSRHHPDVVNLSFVQPANVQAPAPLHLVPHGSQGRRTTSAQPRPDDFLPGQEGTQPLDVNVIGKGKSFEGSQIAIGRGVQPWDGQTTNRYHPIEDVLRYYGERGWELYGVRAEYRRPWEVVAYFQRPVGYAGPR